MDPKEAKDEKDIDMKAAGSWRASARSCIYVNVSFIFSML